MTNRLAVFFAGSEGMPAYIDCFLLRIVAKAHRDDMQISLLVDGCHSPKPLTLQIRYFLCGKPAHMVLHFLFKRFQS